MKKSKTVWRVIQTACLLFVTAAALGVEVCYRRIVLPKGYLWLFDWMETAVLAAGAFAFAAAVILNLKKKRGTKLAWLAAAGITAVLAVLLSAVLSPGKEEVSRSPEKSRIAVVDTDVQSGQRRLCRVSYLFFRYPKEILPFAADSDLKYDWLEEDVCAVTGRDTAGKVRQYLATYGARGSVISYMDPYVPMRGSWTGYDSSGEEWSVEVSSGIRIVTKEGQWFFEESECERYGTIGMTIGEAFSLIMNRDCYEEDGMLMDGGTLTLCRISMDEQEKIVLEKTGEAEGWADYGKADTAPEKFGEPDGSEEPQEPLEPETAEAGYYDDSNFEKEVVLEDGKIRYRMIVLDAALGSRLYGLIKSSDGGKNWEVVSDDPFGGELGQGVDFTFLDENFGFATLAHNGGNTARLYVTEDGGKQYEPVEICHKTETDSAGAIWAPYDYPRMPYEKGGSLYVLCGQGADGDYNGGDQNETARYRSEDNGHTFVFDGMEPTQ